MARRASAVDANQVEIVSALRKAGATVQHLHMVGGGCPDILVGFRRVNFVLEIKDGSKPPSARKLTPSEADWHRDWRGTVYTVNNVDEALEVLGMTAAEIPHRGFIA